MGIHCSEVLADLPLFVGGDLEAPSRDAVSTHLEGCAPCRDALARASEARAVLAEHFERTAATPSGSVWPDLRERLRAEGLVNTPAAEVAVVAGGGRLLRFLPRAAAAAGLLLAGVLAGQWLGGGADVGPAPAIGGTAPEPPGPVASGPQAGESSLQPVVEPEAAVAEAASGLRAVEDGESLGDRASLFDAQPILPFTPFQANQMRMASFGQTTPQQPPVIDRAQLLLQRGIR